MIPLWTPERPDWSNDLPAATLERPGTLLAGHFLEEI